MKADRRAMNALTDFRAVVEFIEGLEEYVPWQVEFNWNGKGQVAEWLVRATPIDGHLELEPFDVRYYLDPTGRTEEPYSISTMCGDAQWTLSNFYKLMYELEDLIQEPGINQVTNENVL